MAQVPDGLQELLEAVRDAPRGDRISFRDQLAAFGEVGIEAVSPWLVDSDLGPFATRVIWAAATAGARPAGIAALRSGRSRAPAAVINHIEFALEQLGARAGAAGPAPREPTVHSVTPTAGEGWPGFHADEFGRIAGTTWRSRDGRASLAPIITRALRYHHPHFESYGIERSPEIHFALRERYRQGDEHGQGWRAGKLVVYAHAPADEATSTPHVTAGIYLEKGFEEEFEGMPSWAAQFGLLDDRWDWPWFVRALRDQHVRDELGKAMAVHDLKLGDYVAARFGHNGGQIGWVCELEDGEPVMRDRNMARVGIGWDDILESLVGASHRSWIDFHVWRSWSKDEAVAAGRSFAFEDVLPVLESLTGIYLDIVAPVLPKISRV